VRQLLLFLVAVPAVRSDPSSRPVRRLDSVAGGAPVPRERRVSSARQGHALRVLPAWSPGSYEIQNYARYVRHFGAKNSQGQPLFWDRFDKDTCGS